MTDRCRTRTNVGNEFSEKETRDEDLGANFSRAPRREYDFLVNMERKVG